MFQALFGTGRAANRRIVDALYETIVAAARRDRPYAVWGVPDTPLGRFEMIALHMMLVQHRLIGAEGAAREVAQGLIDTFFTEVEHSLRELGVGDVSVPKRMKKLARMFYGRTASYAAAIEAGDRTALADALDRNIWPGQAGEHDSSALADYVLAAARSLDSQDVANICSGDLMFPDLVSTP